LRSPSATATKRSSGSVWHRAKRSATSPCADPTARTRDGSGLDQDRASGASAQAGASERSSSRRSISTACSRCGRSADSRTANARVGFPQGSDQDLGLITGVVRQDGGRQLALGLDGGALAQPCQLWHQRPPHRPERLQPRR
jgi:hypothetical protein